MDRNRGFDLNALRHQLEDLIEDFFSNAGARRSGGRGDQNQHLPINLTETDDAYVLTAPLPGYGPEDIEINVRGHNLHLRAQRKSASGENPHYLRHEWGFGSAHRGFDLPGPVDADNATAAFKNGVVTVTVPKAEREKAGSEEPEAAEEAKPEETSESPETTESAATEQPEAEAATEEAAPEAGEAAAETEGEEESTGSRSFYMRPAQGGRRGRQRGGRQGRKSAENGEAEAPAQEPKPAENAEAQPETEAVAAETPDEAAEKASPVEHTTTAGDAAPDLSEQHGAGTDTEDRTDETHADDVTDTVDADQNQTADTPKD